MMSLRLPLFVYWGVAILGFVGAMAFTLLYDFSVLEGTEARQLLFTVWGGPITLVIGATLVTWLKRSMAMRERDTE